jgi:hypothetical protein
MVPKCEYAILSLASGHIGSPDQINYCRTQFIPALDWQAQ